MASSYGKFIVVSTPTIDKYKHLIFITDYEWWNNNSVELYEWIESNIPDIQINGVVIEFKTSAELMMFTLRWG
jgi:hypothetical protein